MRCKNFAVPGEKLAFYFFPFERPLLQNCIMHSSICTNGYFLSCYIDIHARNAAGETCFVSKRYDLPGQASLTACLLWPMYFSPFWPKTTLQLLLDGQDDKQIYIIFFLICKSNKQKKAQILDFHQTSGGTKDKQDTKLNNRRVVMMVARSVFLLIPTLIVFFFPAS